MFTLSLRLSGSVQANSQWEALDWNRRFGLPELGTVYNTTSYCGVNDRSFQVEEAWARQQFGDRVDACFDVDVSLLLPGEIVVSQYYGSPDGKDPRLAISPSLSVERAKELTIQGKHYAQATALEKKVADLTRQVARLEAQIEAHDAAERHEAEDED
jgi:hypothetical protein